jgi:hypothetical protein
MEKHELELVTSTCTMSCNIQLHDCTRYTREYEELSRNGENASCGCEKGRLTLRLVIK